MASADLQVPAFIDETAARAAMEAVLWPNGPVCPRCGKQDKIGVVGGASHRPGLYYCGHCKRQFTVTVGTIFERSKVPLSKWWLAIHLLASSKKGISSHQLYRMLGVTYQTAWFMSHRIREAMRSGELAPMGGAGKIVEADETYFGKRENFMPSSQRGARPYTKRGKSGPANKRAVMALVERGGKARTFHVDRATKVAVTEIVTDNVKRESYLHTDESRLYGDADQLFAEHRTVKHSVGEYVRGTIHTNTVEGMFSIFKRGMTGVYQHCSEKHLHRYLAEFDFRYNNRVALGVDDNARAARTIRGAGGKRLIYRRLDEVCPA
jgi:transposase-like protein